MCDRCNGWQNFETWAVNLWLSNEQDTYDYWREAAREAKRSAIENNVLTWAEVARIDLALRMKDEVLYENPCPAVGLYAELLDAALAEVNWHEVAAAFLEELSEEE